MGKKKNTPKVSAPDLPALKIGSRVRCTDDGVEGRIVWANGVSVKIRWDDGEQVTWRRDSLAGRPVEILDAGDGDQLLPPAEPAATEQAVPTETPQEEPTTATPEPTVSAPAPVAAEQTAPTPASALVPEPTGEQHNPGTAGGPAKTSTKPKRQRKAPAEAKEKKFGALDAAAKVLAEEGRPMSCQELIDAMAAKGYWTSPGGKTPASTLYSAILRELTKGEQSRFVKTERGKFSRQG
jgi:hypothetical protein